MPLKQEIFFNQKGLVMRLFLCVVAFLLSTACSATSAVGFVRPFEAAAQEYYHLLLEEKYSTLEKSAKESRLNNLSISDGQPKLAAIYGGLSGCLSSGCQDRLSEQEWQERLRLLLVWREKHPESVTAEIAHAGFFVEHAYAIRGKGYANTVKADLWPLFYKSMETARGLLEGASPAAKNDPGWYAAMLQVGVAQHWPVDKFHEVYARGKKQVPLYTPLYFAASSYFSPRWYGSTQELKKFIEDAVNATHPQIGETLYARLNWSLQTPTMLRDGQAEWPRMKAGFERIMADFPDSWNINNFAKFACWAKDYSTALGLAEKIGDRPIAAAWSGNPDNYRVCLEQARHAMQKK